MNGVEDTAPIKNSVPMGEPTRETSNLAHGHMWHAHHACGSHCCGFGKKLLLTFFGILIVYLIVFVGTLTRNKIKEYDYIGLSDRMERSILVEAEGVVEVKPDVATISMGVTTEKATVAEAQAENTQTMNTLVERVKALGIPAEDIKTTTYDVFPSYDWTEAAGEELIGYQVSQRVSIKMKDVKLADKVVALAGELGITDVGQLEYTVDDKDAYLVEAREQALKKIADKASALSRMLGVRVISVMSYSEYEITGYDEYGFDLKSSVMGAGSTPTLEAGTSEVRLNVSVSLEIR